MARRSSDDGGFTLVEVMVVVLIIGILASIALPTYLGSRERAADRSAQSDIRNAYSAEKVFFTDAEAFTEDTTEMDRLEPSLDYTASDTPAATHVVYLHYHSATEEVYLSAMSESGTCFYLRAFPDQPVDYASDTGCGVADTQTYASEW